MIKNTEVCIEGGGRRRGRGEGEGGGREGGEGGGRGEGGGGRGRGEEGGGGGKGEEGREGEGRGRGRGREGVQSSSETRGGAWSWAVKASGYKMREYNVLFQYSMLYCVQGRGVTLAAHQQCYCRRCSNTPSSCTVSGKRCHTRSGPEGEQQTQHRNTVTVAL